MCRKCGEPDRRGSARNRRARKRWMLKTFGDGITCTCWLCGVELTYLTVTADRIVPGGPYRRSNIAPACMGCNIARSNAPEGCAFGPVGTLAAAEAA